ncbi:MAG: hypothetical protein Q9160_005834 [Pyrenula sp. 1 TL-2023]
MPGIKRKLSIENVNGQVEAINAKKRALSPPAPSIESRFKSGLFSPPTIQHYTKAYASSQPYHHGVIPSLISSDLLRNVRSEITTHLSFTPKETDIYKIHQSGDLANLSGLDSSSLLKLPSLLSLRDALYSPQFRDFLSHVTGCGALSGQKTDMAINVYTPGSYLLCHDDVIGSRRVSYILYLTDPDEGREWQTEWGGALRLYPTKEKTTKSGDKTQVPSPDFSVSIPPSFGQLSFFEVRPGESFHDVEEVYYPDSQIWGEDTKQWEDDVKKRTRMAISGWFHIPQKGEEGYEEGLEQKLKEMSSLNQLEGRADEFDEPKNIFTSYEILQSRGSRSVVGNGTSEGKDKENMVENGDYQNDILTEPELDFLLQYLSPSYLAPDMIEQLATSFSENSFLQLEQVLKPEFASLLKSHIETEEKHKTSDPSWVTAAPPHKHRYLFQSSTPSTSSNTKRVSSKTDPLDALLNTLLPSPLFRKWLALATSLSPSNLISHNTIARRFRRGLDYALASSYDPEGTNPIIGTRAGAEAEGETEEPQPRLEFTLSLTPSPGWEPPDPPASSNPSTPTTPATATSAAPRIEPGGTTIYLSTTPSSSSSHPQLPTTGSDPAIYQSRGDNDDDGGGILFASTPAWNRMSIVLRDAGVLRFVKFVSRAAQGDVWDVLGEVRVEGLGGEESERDEDGEEEEEDEGEEEEEDEDEGNGEEDGEEWQGIDD